MYANARAINFNPTHTNSLSLSLALSVYTHENPNLRARAKAIIKFNELIKIENNYDYNKDLIIYCDSIEIDFKIIKNTSLFIETVNGSKYEILNYDKEIMNINDLTYNMKNGEVITLGVHISLINVSEKEVLVIFLENVNDKLICNIHTATQP